jgi:3' terminal RNA ribose 2'-O-methyltransferase Hen1
MSRVYGSALSGKSRERPELAVTPLPLRAGISVLPCRGGEGLLRRLFEPLGYEISAERHPLDEEFPEWGESPYYTVGLSAEVRLRDLLRHLYVLVPVLDDDKHYWVGDEEVEKLLRSGEEWLAQHPERALISERYLKHQSRLTREALLRLMEEDEAEDAGDREEEAVEESISLGQQRLGAVVAALKNSGARRVLDLGCGEGKLLAALLKDRSFEELVGMDVSARFLEIAHDRLRLDRLPPGRQVTLIQGSLTYRDGRLAGYDAAAVVEVIEHLDPWRLSAFERVLFGHARPGTVVLTTPNAEYNVNFEAMPAGRFRHRDHRFEWTREEFRIWAAGVAGRSGYATRFVPVGPDDPVTGPPTQMAVFEMEPAA